MGDGYFGTGLLLDGPCTSASRQSLVVVGVGGGRGVILSFRFASFITSIKEGAEETSFPSALPPLPRPSRAAVLARRHVLAAG